MTDKPIRQTTQSALDVADLTAQDEAWAEKAERDAIERDRRIELQEFAGENPPDGKDAA